MRRNGTRRPPTAVGSIRRASGVRTKLRPPPRTSSTTIAKLACFMFVPNAQRQAAPPTTEDRPPARQQGRVAEAGWRPYRVSSSAFVGVRQRVRRECQLAAESAGKADYRKLSTLPRGGAKPCSAIEPSALRHGCRGDPKHDYCPRRRPRIAQDGATIRRQSPAVNTSRVNYVGCFPPGHTIPPWVLDHPPPTCSFVAT